MAISNLIPLKRPKSGGIFKQSSEVIPSGVNSPVRAFPSLEQTPLVIESGYEDKIVDVDGHTYIDYCGSWGALIHGHAHPRIVVAAQAQVARGSSFGVTTAIEAQLARLVVENVPAVEKVRFVSSGTEATMSAIRLARGFTKRDKIVKFSGHYHGHADAFLVQAGSGLVQLNPTSSSAGVPEGAIENTICLPFNDLEALRTLFAKEGESIAAVILEPVAANMGVVEPSFEFLNTLRELLTLHRGLLIFDEVITGFRVGLGGASVYFEMEPDLLCFGKIVGGGFPAAAFGGKAFIMDLLAPAGPVYQAGTLSGNPVAMHAGYQALSMCMESGFYQTLEEKTKMITDPIEQLIKDKGLNLCLHRVGSMFTLFFGKKEVQTFEDVKGCDLERFNRFFQALFQKGIYLSPSQFEANFISAAHSEGSLIYTRDCILEALIA